MKRILILLFIIFSINAQIIQRIHKNPADIFVLSDWKVYKAIRSINDIVESNSFIYFATTGAGILRYDKFKDEFVFPYTESNGLISNNISHFITSKADSGIVFKTRVAIQTDRGKQAFALEQSDNFRFLDDAGITFQNSGEKSSRTRALGDENYFLEQPFNFIKPNIASGPGFQEFRITKRYDDLTGGVWLIVDNFGFFHANTSSGFYKAIRFGPITNTILDLQIVDDNVWLTQNSNNNDLLPVLTKWSLSNTWTHYYEKYSMEINSPYYTKALAFKERIWFAGKFGLLSFDPKNESFDEYRFKGLYNTAISDLYAIGDTLLLASSNGLYFYSPKKDQISQLVSKLIGNVQINAIAANASMIFVSTRFGLYQINRADMSVRNFKTKLQFPNFKTDVIEYQDEKFWFNNSDGIFSYDPKRDEVKQIHLSSAFFTLNVNAIKVVKNNIFLATDKGLLMFLNGNDEWIWITRREGLPSNQLTDIEIDGDFLILSSSQGIAEFLWNDPNRNY